MQEQKELFKAGGDEISPITNNKSVIVDQDPATGLVSKLCLESGFTTNSFLIKGSKTMQDLEAQLPNIAKDLKVVDKLGWVWIPMMQNTEQAVIYPVGTVDKWVWQVSPLKTGDVVESEEENFNPNNPGNYQMIEVLYEHAKEFESSNFREAFEYLIDQSN